ncbi:elongation factor G [Acidocella sp.]|jgi:elongation factor G|uniref:elongation factor G n=1 Tax=Acidocella sp. TaxID=50710 RepID=UPI002F416699
MPNAEAHTRLHAPRAIALVGAYGSGKTTLFEALLAAAGTRLRHNGDTKPPEPSTETRLGHCTFLGDAWALLDCAGSIEFLHETASALAVVDLAVVVVEPDPARVIALRPIFHLLEQAKLPFIVFINKTDTLKAAPRDLVAALQAEADLPLVLRQVPIREGEVIAGYVDLVSERAYRYRPHMRSELIRMPAMIAAAEASAHEALVDTLADHDDALLEKVIDGVIPTPNELYEQLHKDLAARHLAEVMFGAAERANGVLRLWKALRHDTPAHAVTAARHGIEPDGPPLAQIFKTSYAGQAGKLSYARIWRGTLRDGAGVNNQRIGGIVRFPGQDIQKIPEAVAGDLVALGRLDSMATGTVLGDGETLPFPAPPAPVYALAIATPDRKDDVKLSTALQKLFEEDPSLSMNRDAETGDTLLAGQGEIHLHRAIERLAKAWGLTLTTARPRVRFKETISKAVHEHARLKRQTGGHGQFADVKLYLEPRTRGQGFHFTDQIVGGSVPRQYIPAVAAAAEEAMHKGPFGYPVVDVGVTLTEGSFHAVDSSDMAFRSATRAGIAEALAKAGPVLLEPIHRVKVSAPNMFTANVQRLLTTRRGQILGYGEKPGWAGWDDTEALLPETEMHRLILDLRSQTAGLGTFTHHFEHLTEAASQLAERIAREAASQ